MAGGRVDRWWRGRAEATPAADPSAQGPTPIGRMDRGIMPRSADAALGYVRELDALVTGNGGQTLVFYIPAPYMVGDYSSGCRYAPSACRDAGEENGLGAFLSDWFASEGIAFIDPTPQIRELEADGVRLHLAPDSHLGADRTSRGRPNTVRLHRQPSRFAEVRLVPRGGLEPPTRGFSVHCSTN